MKNLKLLLGALLLLITTNTFSQNNTIEGKWKMPNFDNTMYIFENGEATYFLDSNGYLIKRENVSKGLPFIFFLAMLGMLYIANHHYAEKSVRNSEKIKKELKELYWEHLNISSNLMTQSKQTEVAKLPEVFGLKESVVPPTKLEVNE
jgi:hypothetical protein